MSMPTSCAASSERLEIASDSFCVAYGMGAYGTGHAGSDGKTNRADRLLSDEIELRFLFRGDACRWLGESYSSKGHSNSNRTISGCEPTRRGGPQVPAPLEV